MTTMIALVGEQPIPNLLPIRLLQPEQLLLVHTDRTEKVAGRIQELATQSEVGLCKVDAYNIEKIRASLEPELVEAGSAVFNLTGGTKPMMLAAYMLASRSESPYIYLQTEGQRGRDQQTVIYHYRFQDHLAALTERQVVRDGVISLDDYLRAHFGSYHVDNPGHGKRHDKEQGWALEKAVHDALDGWADEIKAGVRPGGMKDQVEIDLVIRCGNHVGFIEVKSGGEGSGKKAVDQLTTLGARELSGIYSARFLVIGKGHSDQYRAVAERLDVSVIEVRGLSVGSKRLNDQDANNLRQAIRQRLPMPRQRRA